MPRETQLASLLSSISNKPMAKSDNEIIQGRTVGHYHVLPTELERDVIAPARESVLRLLAGIGSDRFVDFVIDVLCLSYCQMSWMKPEAQAAILVPSLNIVPAITAGSNVLPLSFRQWF